MLWRNVWKTAQCDKLPKGLPLPGDRHGTGGPPKNIKANFGWKSIFPYYPRLPLLPRNAQLARLSARTLACVPCNRLERISGAILAVLRTHPLP